MIHVADYRTWRKTQLEDAELRDDLCFECEGAGSFVCFECEGTGEDWGNDKDCEFCDGCGFLECNACHGDSGVNVTDYAYRDQLLKDAYDYAGFTGAEPLAVLGSMVQGGAFQ